MNSISRSTTTSSFEVISYFYELDIHIFSRSVDSLFFSQSGFCHRNSDFRLTAINFEAALYCVRLAALALLLAVVV